jgi:hypothetical protein
MNLHALLRELEQATNATNQVRQELQSAMGSIRRAIGQMASLGDGTVTVGVNGDEASASIYAEMNVGDAAKAHLVSMDGAVQSSSAMEKAVRAGGHPSKSKTLGSNINTALERRKDPELEKGKDGWRYIGPRQRHNT